MDERIGKLSDLIAHTAPVDRAGAANVELFGKPAAGRRQIGRVVYVPARQARRLAHRAFFLPAPLDLPAFYLSDQVRLNLEMTPADRV